MGGRSKRAGWRHRCRLQLFHREAGAAAPSSPRQRLAARTLGLAGEAVGSRNAVAASGAAAAIHRAGLAGAGAGLAQGVEHHPVVLDALPIGADRIGCATPSSSMTNRVCAAPRSTHSGCGSLPSWW
jgi:hypothetical protein